MDRDAMGVRARAFDNHSAPMRPVDRRLPAIGSCRSALRRSGLRWAIFVLSVLLVAPCLAQTPQNPIADPSKLRQLSLTELMDLDVTSVSKEPEPYREAPAAIQVITGDDIRRSGYSTIPDALRLADNLHVAQKASHNWAISARGFNTDSANKLLVLMDGRSVYTPLFSGVFWDQQDYLLEDIDRIEVISGPGGTLWGANAVNGVINIITKSAKDTQGLFVETGAGSYLQGFAGVRYGGKLGSKAYYRVYGKYFNRDNLVLPNGTQAHDAWYLGRGGFRIDGERAERDTFTLQGDYYTGDERVATGGIARIAGGNVLGRWSRTISPASDLRLQFYYDRTHLRLPVPGMAFAPAGTLVDDLDTVDLDFQHRFQLNPDNRVVWGAGYRFTHNAVKNAPALAFIPATLNHHLFSAFVQDEIQLARNAKLTLGTKVEHNGYTGTEFEPSARFAWIATPRQTLWAAVSRAIRAPSRIDRDVRLPTPLLSPIINNLLVGGAKFRSETVIAYEVGYRAQLGTKVSGSLAGFYNSYDDVRSTSVSPPPALVGLPLFYDNNLQGRTYGAELSLIYQALERWRLRAGYNYLQEQIRVRAGKFDFNNALNETADPRNQFSLWSSMDLGRNVELDAGMRWVDSFQFNNAGVAGRVPDYFELDVRLGWHATRHLSVSVAGQNLLHDHHLEYVIASPNPREEIVRSVYGRIAWRF